MMDRAKNNFQVLLIEDNPADVRLIFELLKVVNGYSFEIHHVDRLDIGLQRLDKVQMDVIVLDLTLPDSEGYVTFTSLYEHAPNIPIVLLTETDDEELGIQAIRDGAQDYLIKNDLSGELLARAIRYAVGRKLATDALR